MGFCGVSVFDKDFISGFNIGTDFLVCHNLPTLRRRNAILATYFDFITFRRLIREADMKFILYQRVFLRCYVEYRLGDCFRNVCNTGAVQCNLK